MSVRSYLRHLKAVREFGLKLKAEGWELKAEFCENCGKGPIVRRGEEMLCPRCTFGRTFPETRERLGLGFEPWQSTATGGDAQKERQ